MSVYNHIKLFFLLLWGVCATNYGQKYSITNQTELSHLSNAFVYTINQDKNGYLWIGTSDGLYRFDGFDVSDFNISDSLADNFITCSYQSKDGLWFGHMNGSLSFYHNDRFEKLSAPISGNSIANIAESPDGSIWVGTFTGGLLKISPKLRTTRYNFGEEQVTLYSFCFITNEKVLIGSYDGLRICSITSDRRITIDKHLIDIPKTKIQKIQKKKNGPEFFVLTQNEGLYTLQIQGDQPVIKRLDKRDMLPDGIQSFLEDKKGNLWIGSFGHGLYKLNLDPEDNIIQNLRIGNPDAGTSGNIKTLYQDRDENIWLGNYGSGVQKINSLPFSYMHCHRAKYGKSVLAIWVDNKYKWIGTEKGLIRCENVGLDSLVFKGNPKDFPMDAVSTLYSHENTLYIGTTNKGAYKLNKSNNDLKRIKIHDGILENNITSMSGNGNDLWIGTKKGLCYLNLTTDSLRWYTISQGGLPHNSVKHIFIDSKKMVWATTLSNTLIHIDNGEIKRTRIVSGKGIVTLESVVEDQSGRIWIGSVGGGIFLLEKDSVLNLTSQEGLFSDYCYSLLCDSSGYIWVGHRGGLSRIHTNDLSIKSIQKISGTEEIYDFNPNAIFMDSDHKIWFGMNKGLLRYDPMFENTESLPPIININSIIINNQEVEVKNKIKLAPGKYKIRIDFIGINLKNPEKVKYQYRLVGYDDEWSEISTSNSAVFLRLTEGTYLFELNAASPDGVSTKEPTRIQFHIQTPVYKRFYTYLILLFIVSLIIFLYIKRREYIHQHEKLSLEKKVQERTMEIQRQKREIEIQRDLIRSKNKDITDSLKYARKLQSSIAPPEELLIKLFPEHFLISKPKDIVSGDFCWYTETQNLSIVTVADCTGHGVPGAIMSILGITSLNDIIINYGITAPDRILELLRLKVITSLSQQAKETPSLDGMNLGLCVIDQESLDIQFSGAINNLIHIRDHELNVIKADRIPIGFSYMEDKPYTCHELQGKKGDLLYLFSDGFQDQFGGKNDKKYSSGRFIKTLYSIHNKPLAAQKKELEDILSDWMKGAEQTDDITILCIRL
jgi:ligand-binding sensor domain-containing protein/serine phosphatase RsbU (regulator of sigma subunit)